MDCSERALIKSTHKREREKYIQLNEQKRERENESPFFLFGIRFGRTPEMLGWWKGGERHDEKGRLSIFILRGVRPGWKHYTATKEEKEKKDDGGGIHYTLE